MRADSSVSFDSVPGFRYDTAERRKHICTAATQSIYSVHMRFLHRVHVLFILEVHISWAPRRQSNLFFNISRISLMMIIDFLYLSASPASPDIESIKVLQ